MYCFSLIQEQVTPTSVTGTFAERSPFQSTRPTELTSQTLESQQSFGGSSFHGTLTNYLTTFCCQHLLPANPDSVMLPTAHKLGCC